MYFGATIFRLRLGIVIFNVPGILFSDPDIEPMLD